MSFRYSFASTPVRISSAASEELTKAGDLRDASRSWLFWLLISTGPLYHAALSLAALHQTRVNAPGAIATEQPSYHARALSDLHSFLGDIQDVGNFDSINEQIQILSCGVSLISFELFRGGNEDWRPHLDALTSLSAVQDRSILSAIELEQWQTASLSFFVPVTVWFDLLSCASTGAAPRVPYRELFDTVFGNLQSVMGCESWVMGMIGDLAHLNHWKVSQQGVGRLSIPQLVSKSNHAEQELERELEKLRSDPGRAITRVFACGTLVYLHSIVSGPYPALAEINRAVSMTLDALEAIEDTQMIRGLIWPLCIAACLATPDLRLRFKHVIARVVNVAGDFGNSGSILKIAETCWKLQNTDEATGVDWRMAMDELGAYVLLV
jgi:hypothetical protein